MPLLVATVVWSLLLTGVLGLPFLTSSATLGDDLIRNTVRLVLLYYAAALNLLLLLHPLDWPARTPRSRLARGCWTLAWLTYLIHLAMAFQYAHAWSHTAAVAHVREVSGVGEGIFVSYFFTLVWTADVLFWWLRPEAYARRAPWIGRTLHGFMLFVVFNATVVYEQGLIRWAGAVLFVELAALAWARRLRASRKVGTMNAILTEVDAWIMGLVLAVAMLGGWGIGGWVGARRARQQPEAPASKFSDAILALLGLLLGFSFALSQGKHEQRRQMVVTDANSIGDFYTCVSLVKEPEKGQLQAIIRRYVEHRVHLAQSHPDAAQLNAAIVQIQEMHDEMTVWVRVAVDAGTPVTVPLVNTLNGVTSAHAARLAALHDRLPGSIVALLFLAAFVAMALVGWQQGATGHRDTAATFAFILLVSMVVWVILDLNQPRHGWITVSQEALERLLVGMRN